MLHRNVKIWEINFPPIYGVQDRCIFRPLLHSFSPIFHNFSSPTQYNFFPKQPSQQVCTLLYCLQTVDIQYKHKTCTERIICRSVLRGGARGACTPLSFRTPLFFSHPPARGGAKKNRGIPPFVLLPPCFPNPSPTMYDC